MDVENGLTREELLSCMQLGKALTAELDSNQLFGRIMEKVSQLLPAENWSLLLGTMTHAHFLRWPAVSWNGHLLPGKKSIHNPRRTNRTPAPDLM
jgi:hypothetical protein